MLSLLKAYRLYVFVIGALFLSACSSTSGPVRLYEGVAKQDSDIVKLSVPAALDILEIDNKAFKDSPHIAEGQYHLNLLPGVHSFKVRYSQIWGSDALGMMVSSDIFYFTLETSAGSVYNFKHNGPEDLLDAEFDNVVEDIKIWLEEYKQGQQKTASKIEAVGVYTYSNLQSSFLGKGGVVTKRTAVKGLARQVPLAEQVQQKELNNIKQKASEQLEFWWKIANTEQRKVFEDWLVTLKEVSGSKTSDSMQQKAAEQLKFWWKLANTEQRKSFLLWIKK